MSSVKVSVVIPIYNCDHYLNDCLQSVRQQTLKEIEILCVDDCSPDGSAEIVRYHQSQDKRIALIQHHQNLGPGGARNTGIRSAKADYLAFVDSDDLVNPKMLEKLWNATENCRFDVVSCGFDRVGTDGTVLSTHAFKERILEINEKINIFRATNIELWNKLWRKLLFTKFDIWFPNHVYYDDAATTPRLLAKSESLRTIKDKLYTYSVHPKSISFETSSKHITDYFKVYDILYDFLSKHDLSEEYTEEMFAYIDRTINYHARSGICSIDDENLQIQNLRHLLMFKIGYIENQQHLIGLNKKQILKLLASGHSSIRSGQKLKTKAEKTRKRQDSIFAKILKKVTREY